MDLAESFDFTRIFPVTDRTRGLVLGRPGIHPKRRGAPLPAALHAFAGPARGMHGVRWQSEERTPTPLWLGRDRGAGLGWCLPVSDGGEEGRFRNTVIFTGKRGLGRQNGGKSVTKCPIFGFCWVMVGPP